MIIDFNGGSLSQKYTANDPERTINWLPVISTQEAGEKTVSKMALYPTPGLSTFCTPTGTNMRGLYTARTHASSTPGKCFAVIDRTLYEISTSGVATSRGTLTNITNDTSTVYMVANAADELGIFHSSAAYCLNMSTNVLTEITNLQYPDNVEGQPAYMDGYVFVVSEGSVYWADPNNMLTGWSSLNVLSPTSTPAEVIAVVCYNQQLYCFTSDGIDVYSNDGSTPFVRLPRTSSRIGLVAKDSIVITSDGMLFLGRSKNGEANVYMLDNNYQCKPLPSTAMPWKINNTASSLIDSYAHIQHTKEGHILYLITIPGTSTTYVFDLTTGLWHERNSVNPNTSAQGEFRGRYYTNFDSKNLYGDLYGNVIMKEDYTVFTEDGAGSAQNIRRTRISPLLTKENMLISVHDIEVMINSGASNATVTDGVLKVSYAKDANGAIFNTPRDVKVGAQGAGYWRARLTKLGAARWWTLKIVLDDAIDVAILDVIAHGTFGTR